MKNRLQKWGAVLVIFLTFAAYYPAMQGEFIWDDDEYVTDNETLRTLEGLKRIWFELGAVVQYYPMVFTSYWAEYHLWELHPLGYHFDNVALHSLNSILLWRVLAQLSVPGAWFAAALFALHPIQVESVAWITERKNTLSGFFYLCSLWVYLRFSGLGAVGSLKQNGAAVPRRWALYVLSWFFFMLALWSKTVTSSLPAVILLLHWWKQNRVGWKNVLLMYPYFVAGLGMAFVTMWMERHAGALGKEWDFSFAERFLIAGRALWFYAGKLVWPVDLTFSYPRWSIDPQAWQQYLFPFAFLVVLAALWAWRKRLGKGALTAALFFAGTLLPALGFVDVYPMRFSFVADHFQYLASAGLLALFAAAWRKGSVRLARSLSWTGWRASFFEMAAPLLLLSILGILTWKQSHIYKDAETLWRDTLAKNPSSWMAHNNLGGILASRGEREEGIRLFIYALKLKPDYLEARYNLGLTLAERGKHKEALIHYSEALRLHPAVAEIHFSMGVSRLALGELNQAVQSFRRALDFNPDYSQARVNLGYALASLGRYEEAVPHYYEALRLDPASADAHNNLGIALFNMGRQEEAVSHFVEALRLQPDHENARRNLEAASRNR
ncbi:MAG: tetratricopeptide repeat protein [Nitrospinales bacterium]